MDGDKNVEIKEMYESEEYDGNEDQATEKLLDRRKFVKGGAAVVATAVVAGGLAACSNGGGDTPAGGSGGAADGTPAADGTYTASAQGRNGQVVTQTTISGGAITKVEVIEHQETDVFGGVAVDPLCQNIVAANSYGIDAIAGATWTSAAIKDGVAAAIAEAGGSADLYNKPTVYENVQDETIDADIAVIGAGFSGLISACVAAESGAKVVLIDKAGIGGCSLQSFGAAIYDSPELIEARLNEWLAGQMYIADPALIYAYLSNNMDAISWVRQFKDTTDFFPFFGEEGFFRGLLCAYTDRPKVYQEMFDKTVLANGGSVHIQTTATELLTDGAGTVTGVVAKRLDGSTLTINAKAVNIATGGFGGNAGLIKELTGYDVVCGSLTQCIGEGEDMAYAVGAPVPKNKGGLQLHQTLATSTAKLSGYEYFQQQMPMVMGYVPSVLNVDGAGKRFRNEDWVNNPTAAATGGAFVGGVTYVLLDQNFIQKLESGGTAAIGYTESPGMPPEYKPDYQPDTPWADFSKVLGDLVPNDWAYTGASIEEVANAAGMDPAVLQATIDTYNGYCAAGKDAIFNKDPQHLVAYDGSGPYYLISITYNHLGTIGGIATNEDFQVLDENKKAIPGLYSTGAEAYGTAWNRNYNGQGDGIGFAMVSGYVAGGILARYAGK
ncbi:MAG: FAD-binding protein [Coriobacteriales bacterium]|jgi:fumarate reductase flavoprotein subunit|nr:FAD-binding protein [Coriobacteriales bacterium]